METVEPILAKPRRDIAEPTHEACIIENELPKSTFEYVEIADPCLKTARIEKLEPES
jgi:hypothetical protein